ncbi:hypothetical protein IscW_ISCW020870 [Ixodes scapularis]|uniref:Uncharacterized protein n=1 Tax=Ixodes scapularis TaxID=6945 RepID=B7Q1I4_IXOSC|nr:hypothetical protein IscW_ISCW020870 [Ixodes scapularis]|eukprot:XP_002409709.1 hypothetical protein IscW_ISCW020870 [Ixodes scapularis]
MTFSNKSFAHAQAPLGATAKARTRVGVLKKGSFATSPASSTTQTNRRGGTRCSANSLPDANGTSCFRHLVSPQCEKKGRLIDIVRLFSSLELCFRWTSSLVSVHRLHVLHKLKTTVYFAARFRS